MSFVKEWKQDFLAFAVKIAQNKEKEWVKKRRIKEIEWKLKVL